MNKLKIATVWMVGVLSACSGLNQGAGLELVRLETRAAKAYQAGDFQAAEAAYRELLTKVPSSSEYWFRLGNTKAQLNEKEQAMLAYREAILRDSRSSKAWYNLVLLQLRSVSDTVAEMGRNLPSDDPALLEIRERMDRILAQGAERP